MQEEMPSDSSPEIYKGPETKGIKYKAFKHSKNLVQIEPPNKELSNLKVWSRNPLYGKIPKRYKNDLSFTPEEQKRNTEVMENYAIVKSLKPEEYSEARKFDVVEKPRHYNEHNIEAIDVIKLVSRDAPDGFCGSLIGNVQKYIYRCWYKGKDLEDLKKARWYLDRLIKYMEKKHVGKT